MTMIFHHSTMQQNRVKRLNKLMINGTPVDLTKTYSIVACEREGDPDSVLCGLKTLLTP